MWPKSCKNRFKSCCVVFEITVQFVFSNFACAPTHMKLNYARIILTNIKMTFTKSKHVIAKVVNY